jgi:hypothetical protein
MPPDLEFADTFYDPKKSLLNSTIRGPRILRTHFARLTREWAVLGSNQ